MIGGYGADELVEERLARRIVLELGILVLVVHIVADAHELLLTIRGSDEHDRDADSVIRGDFACVWWIGLYKYISLV